MDDMRALGLLIKSNAIFTTSPTEPVAFVSPAGKATETFSGLSPYNNFHVARVDLWRSLPFREFLLACLERRVFLQWRVGDAQLHAIVLGLFLGPERVLKDGRLPYQHNLNFPATLYPPGDFRCKSNTTKANNTTIPRTQL